MDVIDNFLMKHECTKIYTVKLQADINLHNITTICEINNIHINKNQFKNVVSIDYNKKSVKMGINSIQICGIHSYIELLLLIDELNKLFNINCKDIKILLILVIITKPCMDLYYKSLNDSHAIIQNENFNSVRYLNYKSTVNIHKSFVNISSAENIIKPFTHFYTHTTLPVVLGILSNHHNSLYATIPYEVTNVILAYSQC